MEVVKCLICYEDDGLAILCGKHWSQFSKWRREKERDEMALPPGGHYDIQAFHVNLADVDEGESVALPTGWEPLGVASVEGNDFTILLYREAVM